jgi:alkylation response protein AidB-like acyl-CoA dehydrogenase
MDASLDDFLAGAESWLADVADPRPAPQLNRWGEGSDRVAVFHDLTYEQERALIDDARQWQRLKSDAGYGSISWPPEYGGAGLPLEYEHAFRRLEANYLTPPMHEAVSISLSIEAPTILALGTESQAKQYVAVLRRADALCCQLFSEPGAGSDLGSIAMRAARDGADWVLSGQKVWTSGARHADIGYVIARTQAAAPRKQALTAFIVDMRLPGVDVRPLRQMSGGSSFNEVFFTDVRVPDSARLGDVGAGWRAAMTTLGFERAASLGGGSGDIHFRRLAQLARHLGRTGDAVIRQELAQLYADARAQEWTNRRAAQRMQAGDVPGPEGSVSKLAMTNGLQRASRVASLLLGPRLAADTGEWGTYAWSDFVTGVPGMRIAGGTDEIQRNTIAERALGLPREPRDTANSDH